MLQVPIQYASDGHVHFSTSCPNIKIFCRLIELAIIINNNRPTDCRGRGGAPVHLYRFESYGKRAPGDDSDGTIAHKSTAGLKIEKKKNTLEK